MNWKVRLKHRQFWIALISSVALFSNQVASLFGYDITLYSDQIQESFETLLLILMALGVVIDPTTEGIKDSKLALTYEKPKKD